MEAHEFIKDFLEYIEKFEKHCKTRGKISNTGVLVNFHSSENGRDYVRLHAFVRTEDGKDEYWQQCFKNTWNELIVCPMFEGFND